MTTKRVTLADVAEAAGVSKATVSLVVRESPLVADDTRARVLQAIDTTGYVYNRAAAGLRSQRTRSVGLIISSISNPFFAEVVNGVEARMSESGHTVLFTQHSESLATQRKLIEVMLETRVDGILLVPAHGTPAHHVDRLRGAGTPVAVLTRRIASGRVPYIGSDNRSGARKAGTHLIEHGARRIAFIGGVEQSSPYVEREEGLMAAVGTSRVAVDVRSFPSPPTRDAGYDTTRRLLKERTFLPDAILAYNDNLALGVMAAIQDHGLAVGRDIRVVGFDGIATARYTIPSLTTVNTKASLIGSLAAETLLKLMADPEADEDLVLPNALAVRASCGCDYDGGDK
ncbi:LacI family DNA-binding transcriptional regulator [Cellulomonas sp.]|uniref:LacI family DNA-binding transcriptional regulator n=1 Tax=Cellulomonas sp. TaxID=40001 RepID=UPI003BAB8FD8